MKIIDQIMVPSDSLSDTRTPDINISILNPILPVLTIKKRHEHNTLFQPSPSHALDINISVLNPLLHSADPKEIAMNTIYSSNHNLPT